MSGSNQSSEDRTEVATQRHLEQAREAGNVPVSREVATLASMAAATTALYYAAPMALNAIGHSATLFLSGGLDATMAGPIGLRLAASAWFGVVFPVLGAALLAGAAAVLIQTNFLLHLGAFQPRFSRVNPAAGIKRVFGTDGVAELIKSLGKLTLLLAAMWIAARRDVSALVIQPLADPHRLPVTLGHAMLDIMIAGLCVQTVVAAADIGWVRFHYGRRMRMSRQDVRDEHRETEGNPQIKARSRRVRVLRARRRMMSAVPKATVVVTNPTHFAVALSYDRGRSVAPRVVAKGVDSLALKIREVAAANNVPVVANPPLAQALWRLDLDTDIPAEHYKAVAEIIAYVWRLRRPAR